MADRIIENLQEECKVFLKDKIPRLYEQMEALLKNATGKLLKHQLREKVQQ